MRAGAEPTTGVYVHIPFCAHRCDYCAFATWTDRGHLMGRYLGALRTEIRRAVDEGLAPVDTVFVGGGTPSLVPADDLVEVLAAIPTTHDAEVTIEANPDAIAPGALDAYRAGGVTRMSFGVQSMRPHVLASLGRTHDPDNVVRAVEGARAAGFESFNLDLILGAAGESIGDWEATLDEVVALDPPHVSAYSLTVEQGTPLAADPRRHPDDDDQAAKYAMVDGALGHGGLAWYEVSNWALPGHESRHNRRYWSGGDYLGVGCSAHGHHDGVRYWNVRTPERYVERIDAGRSAEAGREELDPAARAIEARQLALRTRDGVPVDALDPTDPALDGLVEPGGRGWVLTVRGRLLANEVAIRLR